MSDGDVRASALREQFYPQNIEQFTEWNIRRDFWTARRPGLSAMVRLKDEAEWVVPSLNSIAGWCDEVAVFLQGGQSDGTDKIVEAWADDHPNAIVFRYPFDSLPNGPGHEKQPRGSVYERAYFYSWCQSKTRYSHAMKWDGDMVALDHLGAQVRELMSEHDVIRFRGLDIAGADLKHLSVLPRTAREPRVWRVTPDTWWYSGEKCEYFTHGHNDGHAIVAPAYLHFKWAKSIESARKDWPRHWKKMEHFQRIDARQRRGAPYNGPWPACMQAIVEDRRARAQVR